MKTISAEHVSRKDIAQHLDRCMTGLQVLSKAVAQDFATCGDHFQMLRELLADQAARIDRLERLLVGQGGPPDA